MHDARFAPPQARVAEPDGAVAFETPPGVQFGIRLALLGILTCAAWDLLQAMQALSRHRGALWAGLVEPAIFIALAYGVHRKNRACALFMLARSAISTAFIVLYVPARYRGGEFQSCLLLVAGGIAVWATFEYHRRRRRALAGG